LTILDISDIIRKENFIYYRREFTGTAIYDLPGRKFEGKIDFVIETTPLGKKEITVTLLENVDYPLLSIIHSLKEYISRLENEGKLP
jgi:hypothetical protein